MKRYCLNCGAPTEYSLKKPVFCANCGFSFEKTSQTSTAKVEFQKPNIAKKVNIKEAELDYDTDDDYNDGEDVTKVPNISKLQIETPLEKPVRGVKLKDLMGTATNENSKKERRKEKTKRVGKKQTLEDFAKEAGSLRKNKR